MVLIKRQVPLSNEAGSDVDMEGKKLEGAIDAISIKSNTALLDQLAAVFRYSAEVFEQLYVDVEKSGERIKALKGRIETANNFVPQIDDYIAKASPQIFLSTFGTSYATRIPQDAQLLNPSSRYVAIQEKWEECDVIPDVDALNYYRDEGDAEMGSKLYTNPMYFIEAWVADQEKQTKEAKEARRARREERKKKKGQSKVGKNQQVAEVKKMNRTRYNQWGEKITDDDDVGSAAPSRTASKSDPGVVATTANASDFENKRKKKKKVKKEAARAPSGDAPAPPPAEPTPSKPKSSGPAKMKVTADNTGAAAPPPPAPPAAPAAPAKMKVTADNAGAPAPPAPPAAPAAPVAPAAPSAPAAPEASRSGLLGQIQGGMQLRKTEEAPPEEPAEKSGLLGQIQSGIKLRKVEQKEQAAPSGGGGDTGGFNVAAILQRRLAMEFSSDDEDDDEWDDDDW